VDSYSLISARGMMETEGYYRVYSFFLYLKFCCVNQNNFLTYLTFVILLSSRNNW